MYQLTQFGAGVVRLSDGALIPEDPGNVDWRAFCEWRDEGNKALAADPLPPAPVRDVDTVAPATHDELLGFKAMTPAELEQWVQKNVVDLPSAINAIKNLAIAVSILYRR